ncbi:MAG TPA: hypothetical protein VE783_13135 [Candidatus Limnocylindrales bacterium]|jgi:hypothetical protein|nr:hypothetical protein [Candidatus Limnocylindrales bacterium]
MPEVSTASRKKLLLPQDAKLEELIHDSSPEILIAVAADARLTEDLALAFLERRDLPPQALEELARHSLVAKIRKVRIALVTHSHTPRHVSVPAIRQLYPFELMQIALTPAVAPDVKRAAEEGIIARLATVSSGERFTLAKRSSGRVAAALLHDKEERILTAALLNPQMIEAHVVKALKAEAGTELLAPLVAKHPKWSFRNDVRAALLANRYTPFAAVVKIAAELPLLQLKDALRSMRLPANVKSYVAGMVAKRSGG